MMSNGWSVCLREGRVLNWVCLKLLGIYKSRIDAHKGFKCAYGAVHGGDTCSTRLAHELSVRPFIPAIRACYAQLVACDKAAEAAKTVPHLHHIDGRAFLLVGTALVAVGACTPDPTHLPG